MRLLVDSGCDLPKDILDKYNIEMIPLLIIDKDLKEYKDKIDIFPENIYKAMREGENFTTSQATPEILLEIFKEVAEEKESLIYLSFSSGLSGNYQTAKLLKESLDMEYEDLDIEIIDSKAASIGIGLMAEKMGRMAEEGFSKKEILEELDDYINNMEHLFTVEEMSYLYRGGRINKIGALAGNILNIKPILNIDEEGRLIYKDKVRGKKKLIKKLEAIISKKLKGESLENQSIGIVYGDNKEFALEVENMIRDKFKPKEIIKGNMGSSIAVHTGPGILGITFLKEK